MLKKKGLQLAVNTLVTLILGIIIVGAGLALVNKIFQESKGLPEEVNRQTQEELKNVLLGSNERIAVLDNVKEGKRGEQVPFVVAILNQLEGESADFQLVINGNEDPILSPDGVNCAGVECPVLQGLVDLGTVPRYESKAFYVLVDVPKNVEPGEYAFKVSVKVRGADEYARTKVHVNIK